MLASSYWHMPQRRADVRLSVGIIPLPNFKLTTFSGFVDMLRFAADEGDRSRPHACSWTVLAPKLHGRTLAHLRNRARSDHQRRRWVGTCALLAKLRYDDVVD